MKIFLAPWVWPLHRLRRIADRTPGLALLLLVGLLFCAVRAIRGDRLAALALVGLSFAWMLFNGRLEGPTLLVVSSSHGVTVSDLLALAGLLIAAWRLVPVLLRR